MASEFVAADEDRERILTYNVRVDAGQPLRTAVLEAEGTLKQKEALRDLLRAQPHPKVTPEIRRELFSSRSRGDPYLEPMAADAADAPMDLLG